MKKIMSIFAFSVVIIFVSFTKGVYSNPIVELDPNGLYYPQLSQYENYFNGDIPWDLQNFDYSNCNCDEITKCVVLDHLGNPNYQDKLQAVGMRPTRYFDYETELTDVEGRNKTMWQRMLLQINACDQWNIDRIKVCFDNCEQFDIHSTVYMNENSSENKSWSNPIFNGNLTQDCFTVDVNIEAGQSKIFEFDFFGNAFNAVGLYLPYVHECEMTITYYNKQGDQFNEICEHPYTFKRDDTYYVGVVEKLSLSTTSDINDIESENNNKKKTIKVFDILGKLVLETTLNFQDEYEISNHYFEKGFYIVCEIFENKIKSKKVIVN